MNICVVEFLTKRNAKSIIIAFMIFIKLVINSPYTFSIAAALVIAGFGGIAKACNLNVFWFLGL